MKLPLRMLSLVVLLALAACGYDAEPSEMAESNSSDPSVESSSPSESEREPGDEQEPGPGESGDSTLAEQLDALAVAGDDRGGYDRDDFGEYDRDALLDASLGEHGCYYSPPTMSATTTRARGPCRSHRRLGRGVA